MPSCVQANLSQQGKFVQNAGSAKPPGPQQGVRNRRGGTHKYFVGGTQTPQRRQNMAKKLLVGLVFALVFTTGAFAQFSVYGGLDGISSVTPEIGVGYGLGSLDILGGVNVNFSTRTNEPEEVNGNVTESDNYSISVYTIGVYAGAAPKVSLTGNWSLSFPLLAQFRFSGDSGREYDNPKKVNMSGGNTDKNAGSTTFGLDFKAGGRAAYSLSEHWSLYLGFLANVISWEQQKQERYTGSTADDGTELATTTSRFYIFNGGKFQLGVSYLF
jgi:hypothetical protein